MMKNMNNPTWKTGGMALMLLCTLLTSCSNEELLGEKNPAEDCNTICFGLANHAEPITKSSIDASGSTFTANQFVLRSDQSADTLCLRAVISDGINSSPSTTQHPLTRGVPVTGISDFYDKFHVLAYWKSDNTLMNTFFMNEDASSNDQNVWQTDRIYYWPGSNHTLQFYAWAPIDAQGFVAPSTPQSMDCTYTVPAVASDQKDILVASTSEISGNNNAAVPLQFEHICTAVRFVVGSEMQPGTIQSVALKSVAGSGTYSMSNKLWTLNAAVTDFTQQLNLSTTGSEVDGTDITTAEGTFMMLPQTFASDSPAQVEVVFINENQEPRTLTACIAGSQWPMGNTEPNKLSNSPQYELEFVSEPEYQDAHYVIYPITIKSDDKLPAGGWTLTSNDTDNVTFVEKGKFVSNDVQALVDAGYWLDNYNGTSTLTSTTTGDVQVYVFLKENATESYRNITLSLKPAAQGNYEAKEFSFTQYCPAWNNGMGVEQIQDGDYSWGFSWDSNMKITYNLGKGLGAILASLYIKIFINYPYVTSNWGGLFTDFKVTIDFSKVGKLTTATDLNDGNKNTWELYSFNGLNDASALMAQIESWGGVPDKTLPANPSEFAARACAMKNKYSVQVETDNLTNNTVYRPVLDQANMVWYLPAQNEVANMEVANMIDNLSGDYWTSTAITDPGTTAYKYTAGGSTSPEDRNSVIHVRAVRKK